MKQLYVLHIIDTDKIDEMKNSKIEWEKSSYKDINSMLKNEQKRTKNIFNIGDNLWIDIHNPEWIMLFKYIKVNK